MMSSMITPVTEALNQALVSGTSLRAIGALYAVASLTVVPLTYIRQAYSFSVGYGLSVATMAVALLLSFAFSGGNNISFSQINSIPSILALNALVYGLRLSGFLLTREYTVESKKKQFRDLDKTPRFKRTPLALGVSLLYSFMTSPLLFALRGVGGVVPGSNAEKVQLVFTGISIFGMLLEAVADQHKYLIKKQGGKEGEDKFVGPTTWSYKLCRHPNYFGEILFWLGLFGAGSVSFGKSVVAWVCGSLGLWGILSIMLGASYRLDKKQNEKYVGQVAFEEWKKEVNSSVIPLIK
eukprot:CAMPEP_0171345448 /NCGR_PEP_ID=MMETSP0878-20121228/21605_1 /TAXON_ID=67004 /ORGANISM="Thalassiosira weissflogii, Strain CCMP1336" /LENGTH=294 /DNA_ID=CAMNT_0011848851 /DNA_START=238 /DNA_END=1125 /DNA_ORIENTATION=-